MLTEYLTIQGDRWDTIAFKAYGNSSLFGEIQDSNPNIILTDVFDGGIKILIPIIEIVQVSNLDLLPPWKRIDTSLAQKNSATLAINNQASSTDSGSFDKSFD
jgi:phage tail protein X